MIAPYVWFPITLVVLGGLGFGALFYMSHAEWKKKEKLEAAMKPVETPYGLFKYRWNELCGPRWETDVDIGPSFGVSLEVPDRDGAPDPDQLARIPAVLNSLPSCIAKASAKTECPEHVNEENLLSVELLPSADGESDMTLSFSNGEDGDVGIFVYFCGEELLGELGVD